jgi:UDP-N-acetylglucosamine 4,6-dehydratase/5-epimerase
MNWRDTSVLITGGTGSFGKKFAETVLREHQPRRLVVFSRDELKQYEMKMGGFDHPNVRFFLGDVRDRDRLRRALNDVDVLVHAAALKQVPACEYNPIEAIMTNIMGARNVIEAALDAGVKKVIALSTDKAVNPVNLYGATKLCAEKLFALGNFYSGVKGTAFSCVRYGNVVGSRGSVVPLFLNQRKQGFVTVTDERMTRFWLTLEQGVRFVLRCLEQMQGSEVFVPQIPSMKITDLVKAIAPECELRCIGIRPGEKLHEVLVAEDEARQGFEVGDMYVLQPAHPDLSLHELQGAEPLPEGFHYSSDKNTQWLSVQNLRNLLQGQC